MLVWCVLVLTIGTLFRLSHLLSKGQFIEVELKARMITKNPCQNDFRGDVM